MSALKRKIENSDFNTQPPKVPKTEFSDNPLIDNEAEEDREEENGENDEGDGDDEEDDDEDVDEDGYEDDDFIVREEEEEGNENMEEENSADEVVHRKSHKKLKKNVKQFVLDEDDQLLIQETMNSSRLADFDRSAQDDDRRDEIVPTDLGDESDLNDFIEDDVKDPSEDRLRSKRSSKRVFSSRRDGPTYDQIQEAREIFGDGYDELGDEAFDEFNEDLAAERHLGQEHAKSQASFEYIQLVQNFCLDEDEDIRVKDEPERFQILPFVSRVDISDLKDEAFWIASFMSISTDFAELVQSIETVLRFIHVDKLEIPFIWLYRRDYFSQVLKRDDLWKVFWSDCLWWEIRQKREKLNQRCHKLQELSRASYRRAEQVLNEFPVLLYSQFLDQQKSLVSVQDVMTYFSLLCEGHSVDWKKGSSVEFSDADADNPKRQNFKASKYKKFKALSSVRQLVSLICISSHEIGFSVLHSTTPVIPTVTRSWEEEVGDLLAAGELPTKEQLLSAATIVIATEISYEPIIRHFARAIFRSRASLSTKPTARGKSVITPFSQYFGLHLIENKPIDQFFSKEGLIMFMTLFEAESSGLIEITINSPQKRVGDRFIPDLDPFFAEKLRLFQFFMPPIPIDVAHDIRAGWDLLRLKVLEITVERYLIPFLKADIRSELLQKGKEAILDESSKEFERKLALGPCDKYHEDNRDFTTRTLLSCPEKAAFKKVASVFVTQDQPPALHIAVVDAYGVLVGHQIVSPQLMGQRKDKIKAFLYEYRPDLIVLNSSGSSLSRDLFQLIQKSVIQEIVETIELDKQLKRSKLGYEESDDGENEEVEEELKYAPNVVILDDSLPNIMKNSPRKEILFPDLPADTAAAICLARFAQEPLSEYCSIWRSVDSSYLFGYEVLYLKLHPLQKYVLRDKLVERLQCCLVNAVSDVGVDVNKAIKFAHHVNMLAFVPGLGLRKAESLRQMVQRSVGHLDSRESLLTHKFLGKIVWNNCCGFIRIRGRGDHDNPLENTRIHPECYLMYDFAPKICADALGCESNPSRYSDTVARLMKSVRQDLEKRISKVPEWLDLWENGKPEYFLDHVESNLYINQAKISVELPDCLFTLLLDEYVQELENRGKGKRRIQFEHIKEELRYPWLDLRRPMQSLSAGELFDSIYGESQYSLFVGSRTGFTVLETQDQTYYEGRDNNIRRRQRATVKIDSGIKGYINSNEISDDDYGNISLTERLKVGDNLVGTIIAIFKDKFYVELSIKPSVIEKGEVWWMENRFSDHRAKRFWEQLGKNPLNMFDPYFNEKEALRLATTEEQTRLQHQAQVLTTIASTQTKQPVREGSTNSSINARVIYHPLFANVSFKEAEEKLKREAKGAGAVVIRPSSRGFNYLSLTWAFQENLFKHIIIEEHGKRPNDLGLGARLVIRDDSATYEYSDLDELYAMYIEPLNDLVSAMTKHLKFRFGSSDEVENLMREESRNQPGRIPYYIRLDKEKPGSFILTWLKPGPGKTSQVKMIRVDVTPKGYRVRNEIFSRPSELILWFKKMNEGNR